MEEKDLKIGDKYLLKRNTSKRTWKWVDNAKLVEIDGDTLTFFKVHAQPFVYKVNKEEFLKGGKVKTLNNWWNNKWCNYALRFV
jgi:hypothetical protein